jgi:hypothetical protein
MTTYSLTATTLQATNFKSNVTVAGKVTISDNYPLASASTIEADTLRATDGNVVITDIDTVATAGGVKRWMTITVSKAGAAGKPETFWLPVDTALVK